MVAAPPASAGPEPKYTLPGEFGSIWAVAFIPNSDEVVLGYESGLIKFWSTKKQTVIRTLERMNGTIWTVDASASGDRLAFACDDSVVTVLNLKENYKREFQFTQPTSAKAAVFSPDGLKLATGDRNSTVRVWDLEAQIPSELFGHRLTARTANAWPVRVRMER
jgi:WD40 repeat protein